MRRIDRQIKSSQIAICAYTTHKRRRKFSHIWQSQKELGKKVYDKRDRGHQSKRKAKEKAVLTETHKRGNNTNMSILFHGCTRIKNLQKYN